MQSTSETGVSTYPVPFPGTIWHRNCMIGQFHWHHSKNSLKRFFSGLNNIFSRLFTACTFVMYINLRRQISVNNNNPNIHFIFLKSVLWGTSRLQTWPTSFHSLYNPIGSAISKNSTKYHLCWWHPVNYISLPLLQIQLLHLKYF